MQCSQLARLRLISQILPARRSDDGRRLTTMSQCTEALAVGNLILVVSVLTIQLNELGMVRYFTEFGHDREGVALGAFFTWLSIPIFTRRRKITSRLEVTT